MNAPPSTTVAALCITLQAIAGTANSVAQSITLHVREDAGTTAPEDADRTFAAPHTAIATSADIARRSPSTHITILMHPGVYRITNPLIIRRRDIPSQGSLTLAAADEQRVTISGGRAIVDWTVEENGDWTALLPEVAAGRWAFREFFVGNQRRPRARHPDDGYVRVDQAFADKRSGFTFHAGNLPSDWTGGGELVFLHDWSTSRIPIKSVDHQRRRLTVAFPIGNRADHYRIDHFEPHARYYVENHFAFLDAPGEWFLSDDGVLRYRPLSGETPDSVEAAAPVATQLLKVTGDEHGPVRNVHIRGLRFEHCSWPLPSRGFAASQATAHERRDDSQAAAPRAFVPAAIALARAEDCTITACRVAHLGTSGVELGSRVARCTIEDSVIEDVSGNGVNIGEDSSRSVDGGPWWRDAPEQAAAENVVRNNRIQHCGRQFFGAVGVWVGLARGTRIEHNEIAHHPYTGVSLGWMWNPTSTPAGGNIVSNNHIHHVMQVLSDGGGIYTLGRQPGTKLVSNVIHDVPLNAGRAESNGMFLDEGSDRIEIDGNVIYGTVRSPLRFHRAERLTVRNNVLVVPSAETPPYRYNSTDAETIEKIDNQIIVQAEFNADQVEIPATGPR